MPASPIRIVGTDSIRPQSRILGSTRLNGHVHINFLINMNAIALYYTIIPEKSK